MEPDISACLNPTKGGSVTFTSSTGSHFWQRFYTTSLVTSDRLYFSSPTGIGVIDGLAGPETPLLDPDLRLPEGI